MLDSFLNNAFFSFLAGKLRILVGKFVEENVVQGVLILVQSHVIRVLVPSAQ